MPLKSVILQVIPELSTGGAERTVIEVAEAVVAAGGTALVVSEGGRLEQELAAVGGELIRLPVRAKNPAKILSNARKLERLIATRSVDLVHARSRAPAWSALIAAQRAKVPFVTTYHGIYNQKSRLKGWYNSVMARGDRVIANSQYTAQIVRQRHDTPDDRLEIIPRAVDLARFSADAVSPERLAALRDQWHVREEARLVVVAARLTRWKGQQVVVRAAAQVLTRPEFGDVLFVLAGDDQGRSAYRDELSGEIEDLGLTGRVLIPGHCDDIPAAFALASLALIPSIEPEAFGRSSVEAQAMGCPVIVSDLGALPETISAAGDDGPSQSATGWTFPPGDKDALAARITEVLSRMPDSVAAMSDAARSHVASRFSKQALQKRTLRVYDDLLDIGLSGAFDRKSTLNEEPQTWLNRIPT